MPSSENSEKRRVRAIARARMFGDVPPCVADRYRLLRRVGEGGLGVVWAALDTTLHREIAIKFVRAPGGPDERSQAFAEAIALAKLSHPNIVPIFDVGRDGDEVYIAMELVSGATLQHMLERDPPPWIEILSWFRGIADALVVAHRTGVIHGDIKPSNVMVDDEGRVKVLDFGLARLADREGPLGAAGSTHPSGTPGYLAPERDDGVIDAATDQFAFCVALYFALFRRAPFEPTWNRLTAVDIDRALAQRPRAPRVPSWLFEVARRGLAHDPRQRFPDMASLREALAPRRSPGSLIALVLVPLLGSLAIWQTRANPCERQPGDPPTLLAPPLQTALGGEPAHEVGARVLGDLTAFEIDWRAMRAQTCRSLHAGSSSELLHDLRMVCLDRAWMAMAQLTDVASAAGFDAWDLLPDATSTIGDLSACTDDAQLLAERPATTDDRDLVESIDRGIDSAYVRWLLGDTVGYRDRLQQTHDAYADLARAPRKTLWLADHLGNATNQAGRWADAKLVLQAAVVESHRHVRWPLVEGALLMHLAEADAQLGNGAQAVFLAQQAVAALGGDDDGRQLAAEGQRALGVAWLAAGNPEAALAAFDEASRLPPVRTLRGYEAVGSRFSAAAIANLRGLALERLDRSEQAEASYRAGIDALAPLERTSVVEAQLHNNLGVLLRRLGRADDARAALGHAVAIKTRLGDRDGAAATLMNLANVELAAGDTAAALGVYERAAAVAERAPTLAEIHFNRAIALQQAGRFDASSEAYGAALRIADEHAMGAIAYGARIGRGACAVELARPEPARTDLEAALAIEPANAAAYDRAELRLMLSRALPALARPQAVAWARQARELALAGRHPSLVAAADAVLGSLAADE